MHFYHSWRITWFCRHLGAWVKGISKNLFYIRELGTTHPALLSAVLFMKHLFCWHWSSWKIKGLLSNISHVASGMLRGDTETPSQGSLHALLGPCCPLLASSSSSFSFWSLQAWPSTWNTLLLLPAYSLQTLSPPCLMCMLRCFSHFRLSATSWVLAHQAPLSMEFSRHEYWSGLPCPPPGDLPNPAIKPVSPVSRALQADSLPLSHWGGPCLCRGCCKGELEGSAMVTGVPVRTSWGGSC